MYTRFTVRWVHTMWHKLLYHKFDFLGFFGCCVAIFSIVLLCAVYINECATSVWTYFQQSGGKVLTCPYYKCPFVK